MMEQAKNDIFAVDLTSALMALFKKDFFFFFFWKLTWQQTNLDIGLFSDKKTLIVVCWESQWK